MQIYQAHIYTYVYNNTHSMCVLKAVLPLAHHPHNSMVSHVMCPAAFVPENQILAVDEAKVFCPPDKLHVPEAPSTNSDSAFSLQEDSDMSSSESSSAASSPEPAQPDVEAKDPEVWPQLPFLCLFTKYHQLLFRWVFSLPHWGVAATPIPMFMYEVPSTSFQF